MNPASPFATLTDRIDWQKVDGLVPAIVQDFQSSQVLMMGYMNLKRCKNLDTQQVTFSRAANSVCGLREKPQVMCCN